MNEVQIKAPFGLDKDLTFKEELGIVPKVDLIPSVFFVPGTINIFTDASKKDSFSKATISNSMVLTDNTRRRIVLPADVRYVSANTSTDAELASIVYSLIKFNDSGFGANCVNIFTDSLNAVNMLRMHFYSMNGIFSDEVMTKRFINDLQEDAKVNEMLLLLCEERLHIKLPVNLYYIKAHTNDIGFVRSKFNEVNKEAVCVNDAISLINMNRLVDSQVTLYARCSGY